ncbi:MAG: MaoC family dehydratase, partial [Roseibium sp.]|uniref:MaoC family dehydratase n=1 Tax=Roseibium sp. TaxID=1936156 RepID=UPI002601B0A5
EFASEFDPQPFHLDEEAGQASLLGGLAASGWHTCALVMGLLATGLLNKSTSRGSPRINELKWTKPVFPGDTLTAKAEILETKDMRTKPHLGIVFVRITAVNQSGSQVLRWENPILFKKRKVSA